MGRDCCPNSETPDDATAAVGCNSHPGNVKESSCCVSGSCHDKSRTTAMACDNAVAVPGGACCRHSGSATDEDREDVNHHQHEKEKDAVALKGTSSSLCLAVIRETGADVILFDKSGVPRTFRYNGTKEDFSKLCFDSHGMDGWMSHLLTPCFDEDGNHGNPEESCFCGVDTAHLHAHLRQPDCDTPKGGKKNNSRHHLDKHKVGYFASQILHPAEDEIPETNLMVNMEVSDQLPNVCNNDVIVGDNPNLRPRDGSKRLHKVKHDDHIDYLVHNPETGHLHLEHPSCKSCGKSDIHGKFNPVGKRRLKNVQVHFFEVAPRPFNVLDHIKELFEVNSDRVNAVENIMMHDREENQKRRHHDHDHPARSIPISPTVDKKKQNAHVVRSTLKCPQICCAKEASMVESILKPIEGIEKLRINVPLKQVLVDHDVDRITADELAKTLHSFGATVLRDGDDGLAPQKRLVGRSQLYVQNICCASEIPAINSIIGKLPGVKHLSINTTTKSVYIDHVPTTISANDLCEALNKEHFGAEVRVDAAASLAAASSQSPFVQSTLLLQNEVIESDIEALSTLLQSFVDSSQMEKFVVDIPAKNIVVVHNPFCLTAPQIAVLVTESTTMNATVLIDGADPSRWKYPETLREKKSESDRIDGMDNDEKMTYPRVTVIISGVLWVISMLSLIGGKWEHLKWVALVSIAFGLPPIALKAFRTLRRFQFDTNCLMLFASFGAVALQDFEEAAAVVFLFALSEWLEVRATTRARRALAAIVQLRPEKALLMHPATEELLEVPASSVPVGALVVVKSGDKIPCDGVVVDGISTVDESSLTGESRPVKKSPNAKVSGGTVNSGGSPLTVRTTSSSENSAVSRLIRLVEEAQANRSQTEKIVDEFARLYTPVVVFAALLMCTIPWAFGTEKGREWTNNGLILIVVACPCALIISTPVSYVAGVAATAQKGILVKGGATLEALGKIQHICFDKTGTLTNGEFSLLHLNVLSANFSRTDVMQYLSLMEERASHPVAQAILTAAKNERVVVPKKMVLQKHSIVNGEGVVGVIDGKEVHVGNERMFERLNLLSSVGEHDRLAVEEWKICGGTVGFMSVEGHGIVCAFCAADGIRPEASKVVETLQKMGIHMTMLTGDNQDAAIAIGKQIGLTTDQVKSKLLPEEKLRFVEQLSEGITENTVICNPFKKKRLVLMCGDGVNDAPALAAADVGVAMGQGASLSMETSDVTLLDSNLEKLVYSICMGKRVSWKIIQNVVFSLVVKFIVLGFALAGKTHLWAAIATDVGAMLLVTLNAMMLLPRRQTRASLDVLRGDIEEGKEVRTGLVRQGSCHTDPGSEDGGKPCVTSSVPVAVLESPDRAKKEACKKGCCSSTPNCNDSGLPEENVVHVLEKKQCCGSSCCSSRVDLPPMTT